MNESMTNQADRDLVDVNAVVKKHKNAGIDLFADFENATTFINDVLIVEHFNFQTAHNKIIEATNAFQALPSDIRHKFRNSPQYFVEYCSNPANHEDLVKMNLAKPRVPARNASPSREAAPAGGGAPSAQDNNQVSS